MTRRPWIRAGLGLCALLTIWARASAGADLEPAALFAEGVVSTDLNEFATSFSPDGTVVYYTVSAPDVRNHPFVILESHHGYGGWGTPRVSSFSGGPWSDADPFVSPDGSELFFMSRRPVPGKAPKDDFDLWVVAHGDRGWGDPMHLGNTVNTDGQEVFPSVTRDGVLYFSAAGEDGAGGMDMYRSARVDGRYGPPENLGPLNTEHQESNPLISPDGDFLIFASDRPGGFGGSDLYLSVYRDGTWAPAVNLGERVNSEADELAPGLSPDGERLYFTSRRHDFSPVSPDEPLDYPRLSERLRSAGNGNGDLYVVSTEGLGLPGSAEATDD